MSAQPDALPRAGFRFYLRTEFSLLIGLASAGALLATGNAPLENVTHPLLLGALFLWLFGVILWSAISVARHADFLALKCGEPYGTLILTLAAISIEVMMISAAMLHGANNPTLARDTMFAVIMIALNALVGLSLLLGGLRYHEQQYNLQGTNSYLNVLLALAVIGLILPDYTTSVTAPRFSRPQEIFIIVISLTLYGVFLLIQTVRHRQHFMELQSASAAAASHHDSGKMRSAPYHAVMLIVYLATVVLLAEKFAIPLDNSVERLNMPLALGGAIVAALVLAPEALAAIRASLGNQLQRSVNILLGSALATIGLTIPAVLCIGIITKHPVTLGLQGGNLPLLLLTLAASVITFASGRTNVLQGCIHLVLFAVFLLLIFCP